MNNKKVLFDHDGGIDDLLSLMLLLTMEDIDLIGVTITPADCFLEDATVSTLKILKLFNRTDIPVAKGDLYGVNPFHYDWRAQPKVANALPLMLTTPLDISPLQSQSAQSFIADTLRNSSEPVTCLMTGPCSNLVAALSQEPQEHQEPDLTSKVAEVIWMGGAVNTKGNVAMHNHNGSAEWNVYWDPFAAQKLFAMGLTIKLIALDATDCLPIDLPFLEALAAHRDHPLADLAGQYWATTINAIPAYEYTYHLWDVMATSVLEIAPDAIEYQKMELDIAVTEPNQGQTIKSPGNGQWIDVAVSANREKVLEYVLGKFQRGFS